MSRHQTLTSTSLVEDLTILGRDTHGCAENILEEGQELPLVHLFRVFTHHLVEIVFQGSIVLTEHYLRKLVFKIVEVEVAGGRGSVKLLIGQGLLEHCRSPFQGSQGWLVLQSLLQSPHIQLL